MALAESVKYLLLFQVTKDPVFQLVATRGNSYLKAVSVMIAPIIPEVKLINVSVVQIIVVIPRF